MQMQEIRQLAKQHGLKTARQSKINLVRHIQSAEGNFECFATAIDGVCDQPGCLWREDCFSAAKKAAH
ncbi:SAP domain-containing protein [Thiohalophilus sp.]|uniref:SAP domain-containing protein n=1 Tax=Thiohalophilus sp. TaxID=3028392 RepID=UPI003976214A